MFPRPSVILLLSIVLAGFVIFFDSADPKELDLRRVSRIKVSVEAVAEGKPVRGEWVVPAIRYLGIPEYWLQGGTGTFRTTRSPFDTVFMQLPNGQVVGVDLRHNGFNVTWWDHEPVKSPVTSDRTTYYLLDSLEQPRRMVDFTSSSQFATGLSSRQPSAGLQGVLHRDASRARPSRNSARRGGKRSGGAAWWI